LKPKNSTKTVAKPVESKSLLEKLRAKNSTKTVAKLVESKSQEKKKVERARPAPVVQKVEATRPAPVRSRPVSFAERVGTSRPAPVRSRRVPAVEKVKRSTRTSVESRPSPVNMRAQRSATADSGCSSSSPEGHNFSVGQLVNCRNSEREAWKIGVIAQISPLYVRFERSGPLCSCRFIAPIELEEYTLDAQSCVFSEPRGTYYSHVLESGTKVQCVEVVNNFLHIVRPVMGWIDSSNIIGFTPPKVNLTTEENKKKEIIPEENIVQPTIDDAPAPAILPSVNVFHVPENLSSRDLAILCMDQGVTPMKIQKVMTQYGLVAVISFGTHGEARRVCDLRRFSLPGGHTHLPIQWSEKYLKATRV